MSHLHGIHSVSYDTQDIKTRHDGLGQVHVVRKRERRVISATLKGKENTQILPIACWTVYYLHTHTHTTMKTHKVTDFFNLFTLNGTDRHWIVHMESAMHF